MPLTNVTPITALIPAYTVTPAINTPTFPEDIDQYNSEVPSRIAAETALTGQLNTMISQINTLEANVASMEAATLSAKDAAIAAANFQGTWVNQLTAIGQSWAFNGVLYAVVVAGTDSPTTTPSNWFPLNLASAQVFTPTGDIIATTTQGAIAELDSEKAPKNAPVITGGATIGGVLSLDSVIVFEGAIADAFETTLTITEPTADRVITFPDASITVAGLGSPAFTGTPTAPTPALGSNNTRLATMEALTAALGAEKIRFSAYRATSVQALAATTWTKLQLNAEETDNLNYFDSTTNFRYQPSSVSAAGWYLFTGCVELSNNTGRCAIYKNGVIAKHGSGTADVNSPAVALVYLNGSTDYVEFFAYSTGAVNINFGSDKTYFQGYFIGA